MERIPVSEPPGAEGALPGNQLPEALIIARSQGDPAAFAPLYETYLAPIYRYCYRRMGSHEAAEDVTSLVFERALRSLRSFRGGSVRAWLFAIAHNAVTDAYRRKDTHALIEVADQLLVRPRLRNRSRCSPMSSVYWQRRSPCSRPTSGRSSSSG